MVETICCILNKVRLQGISFHEQITFVADRPGHDMRYAIDVSKIQKEFGWKPLETFESGMWKIRHGVKMFRMLLN